VSYFMRQLRNSPSCCTRYGRLCHNAPQQMQLWNAGRVCSRACAAGPVQQSRPMLLSLLHPLGPSLP
jgi:hypothetical protein